MPPDFRPERVARRLRPFLRLCIIHVYIMYMSCIVCVYVMYMSCTIYVYIMYNYSYMNDTWCGQIVDNFGDNSVDNFSARRSADHPPWTSEPPPRVAMQHPPHSHISNRRPPIGDQRSQIKDLRPLPPHAILQK